MMHKLCFIKMTAKSLLFVALRIIISSLHNNQNLKYYFLTQNGGYQPPQKDKNPTSLCEKWGFSIQAHSTLN